MANDLWKNSKNVDQELADNIIAGKQDWQFVRYDHDKKKWITRPIFYVKYKWSKRYERLTIKDALPLIGSYFQITEDLKEWIKSSKYSALANF